MNCDAEGCRSAAVIRIFELHEDGSLVHPMLCEQHALTIIGGYYRKCTENKAPLTRKTSAHFTLACIATCDANDIAFVFLRGEDGTYFPLEMGKLEAWMLGVLLSRRAKTNRPSTHEAMAALIDGLGGGLHEVIIDQIAELDYRAKLQIARSIDVVTVGVRASDGIALAMATGVPLRVDLELISMNTARAARSPVLEAFKRAGRASDR
ncbi:MAG TPA: bifunctional nuclease domain-containing protein [Pirellulales bacterium]|nr:bifunctional nuclease domain-containing protein [Pirellulales bacterium]